MKLFNRVLIHLLIGIVVILTGWAVCFYAAIVDEINDEVDDSLEDYSELIIIRSLAGKELPSHDSGTNNQYFLREVSALYAQTHPNIVYRDSMIYIKEKGETEPARILTTIFCNKSEQYYELSVSIPTIEKKDLRESIFYLLIGLFVALLFGILLINIWVFRQSMKPFYHLLNWLDNYRLGKKNPPLSNISQVTEFQKLNETVNRFATYSESIFEQQKQFIGNASHEIQTPLAICMNRLEMLMDDEHLTEQQMEEIVKTYGTLEYVSKLNKSLLLLSKIENHQYMDEKDICMNDLLHRYADDYQEVYAHLQIAFHLEEKGKFNLRMNEILATVMVTNLLKNAFVHNKQGGKITVIIEKNGICFRNTGIEKNLDGTRIFERFYQGSKKEGSTGLGLAIVSAICHQYHLKLSYHFENGEHCFRCYCR